MAYRIDNATAAETLPEIGPVGVTPNGYFQTRDVELGTPSTVLDSDWLNSYQEEICSVIEGAGITLDKTETDQLYQAIQTLISNSVNNVTPVLLKTISQTGHGFVKGDVLYHTGTVYAKARANSLASSWTVGMVYQVVSANTFKIVQIGYITGLSGLTVGANYLSVTTAGALTITQPAGTDTEVIKPCFIADSTTSGYFFNFAPVQAGSILDGVMLGANNLSDVVSASTARTNLGLGTAAVADSSTFQAVNTTLTAIANGVTPTADSMAYFTGATTASRTNLTAFGRSLIDDADAATAQATLGLVIGTNVQAYDADLAAIAGLTSAADSLPYFTGVGAAALTTLTTFGRSLIDDADAATARTTLGLVIGTNVQAYDADLLAIAGLTSAADRLPYFTGSATAALATFTTFGRSLVDDVDAATARATLGLVIGTDVQAYSAALLDLASQWIPADATNPAQLHFHEATNNGVSRVTFRGQTSLAGNIIINLPAAAGTLLTDADIGSTVQAKLSGASLTAVTVAADDKVLIQDTSDSNNLKSVTAQSIADLAAGGGGGDPYACHGRLSPVSTAPYNVSTGYYPGANNPLTSLNTVYFVPYKGNQIGLYSSGSWSLVTFTATSIACSGGTGNQSNDIFAYNNSGVLALEIHGWGGTNNRSTGNKLAVQDGIVIKAGDPTRRYLGSVFLNPSNLYSMSNDRCDLWNYYNRLPYLMTLLPAGSSYTINDSTSWRNINNTGTLTQFNIMTGYSDSVPDGSTTLGPSFDGGGGPFIQFGIHNFQVSSNIAGNSLYAMGIGTANGQFPSKYNTTIGFRNGGSSITNTVNFSTIISPSLGLDSYQACETTSTDTGTYTVTLQDASSFTQATLTALVNC